MSDVLESHTLALLRKIDTKLDGVATDVRDLRVRMGLVEQHVSLVEQGLTALSVRVDRLSDRIERIETRLELRDTHEA